MKFLSEIAVALTKSTYPVRSLILSPWKLLKFSCITGDLQQPQSQSFVMNLYTACFYKRKVNKHSQIQLTHYCPVLLIYTP